MLKLKYQYLKEVFKIEKYELAIIGAGPVGLFAANYAQLHNLKTIIFDSLSDVGGQPQMLYPYKTITDIPAYSKIKSHQLINNLVSNLTAKVTIKTNHRVKNIHQINDTFIIDDEFKVKSIIIATGNGAFKPKKIPVKLSSAASQKVNYFIKNPQQFVNQKIGVFGGGDSALDFALELAKNNQICLIHRRNEFRGLESSVQKLKSLRNVEILTPYLPKEITLVDNCLQVGLKKVGTADDLIYQKFDQIIVAYGFRANNRFLKNWGIELEKDRIKVNTEMKTNIHGIYAIGDAVTYEGRVPIIGIGFGEAQIAINSIMKDLFPQKTLTIHSTSL